MFGLKKNKLFVALTAAFVFAVGLYTVIVYQQSIAESVLARTGRVKAALTAVTLNNGNGSVITGNDVTSQTTALSPDIGANRWTVDGSSYMVLNAPFDASGSVTDFSGSGLVGTINGGATYTDTGCKVGGCFSFDGVDDSVSFGDVTAVEGQSALTISAWVYPTEYAQSTSNLDLRGIVSKAQINADNTSTFWTFFQGDNASSYIFSCGVDTTTGFPGVQIPAPANFPLNTWTHFVCTWTSGSPVRVYVNGTLVASSVNLGGTTVNIPEPLYIGWSSNSTDDRFKGKLDEVQVYARGVNQDQVTQMYNDGNAGLGGPTTIKSAETSVGQLWDLTVTPITLAGSVGTPVVSTNPAVIVASTPTITGSLNDADDGTPIIATLSMPGGSTAGYRWIMNNTNVMALNVPFNSGVTVADVSGSGMSGTPLGNATHTTSGCKVGTCYSFDGSGDSVNLGTPTSLQITTMSAEAWIKRNATAALHHVIASANGGWAFYIKSNSTLNLGKIGTNEISSTGTVADTNWHHVAFTYNGSTVSFYIDGVLSNSAAYANPSFASTQKAIGIRPDNSTDSFNGLIDEVKVYPRVLTAQQIARSYSEGLGSSQSATNGVGGPTRILQGEHNATESWDLIATEFSSVGALGATGYIDSVTVATASATTLGITTPGTDQSGNVTMTYSCANPASAPRDILVEYSTNGGGAFANASVVSTSSGTLDGSTLSQVACASGTSNNTFVWDSLANGVGTNSTVQMRITAQYPSGPSTSTTNFTVNNGTVNLITTPTTIGSGNATYDGTTIVCSGTTLTVDGTHTFNNLILSNGCTLTQTATTTVTITRTVLTITNSFSVDSSSSLNLDGKGFTAGRTSDGAGGQTNIGGANNGDRSGGSHGGVGGGQDSATGLAPSPYDSISQPTEPGSGSGGNVGTSGGGAIKITTASFTMNGTMSANGSNGSFGAGAGGSIWVIASGSVTGAGTIRANGGNSTFTGNNNGSGSGGRVALHYSTAQPGNGTISLVFQTFGGTQTGNATTNERGGAGTAYVEKTDVHAAGQGNVTIANNNLSLHPLRLTPIPTSSTFADVIIKDQAIAQAETFTAANVSLLTTGRLQHDFATTSVIKRLNLTVSGNLTIDATSSINLDGRGLLAGWTSNGAGGQQIIAGVNQGDRSGGSHGGVGGGQDNATGLPPAAFDSLTQPTEPGSGAGGNGGGVGGGYVKIVAGSLTLAGTITGNGTTGSTGGGAGGGAWIVVSGTISGTGTIRMNGANAAWIGSHSGAGAGGRIALYYDTSQPGNSSLTPTVQAFGLTQLVTDTQPQRGGAGTIYIEYTNVHTAGQGIIRAANNGVVTNKFTPLSNGTYVSLTSRDGAYVYNNGTLTATDIVLDNSGQMLALNINATNFTATINSLLTHEFTTTSVIYRQLLTITGTLSFDATSTIQADGRGLLAGRTSDGAGGQQIIAGVNQGDRSGGSHGGVGGGQDNAAGLSPAAYDSFSQPTEPGSGSGGNNGTSGGGAVKIVTNNLVLNGIISMNGNTGSVGGGAGGGIWIIATGAISGTGTIRANGGGAGWIGSHSGAGAGGRIALHYNSSVSGNGTLGLTFQAFGNVQASFDTQMQRGGAGTVYLEETNADVAGRGDLIVANNGIIARKETPFASGMTVGSVTIRDGAYILASTFTTLAHLNILTSGAINHAYSTASVIERLDITVGGTTTIDSTASIIADSRGLLAGRTSDGGTGQTIIGGVNQGDRSGGSHGGRGGGQDGGAGLPPAEYDNVLQPNQPGSGSGGNGGASGGGVVKLTTGGFVMNGTITANGTQGGWPGSAGGSIWVTTTGLISGTGTMRVNGGNATWTGNFNGAGGGGLIAFYYSSVASGVTAPPYTFQAYGGILSGNDTQNERGGAGIVLLRDTDAAAPDIIVDNNNLNYSRNTLYFRSGQATTASVRHVTADHFGRLELAAPGTTFAASGVVSQINSGVIINNLGGGFTVQSINIANTTLATALVNVAYSQTIQSLGGYGPHTFVCRSGGVTVACATVLPAGLNMSSAGVVSGTPTVAGTTNFTVRATEALPGTGFDEETISLSVGNGPTAPTNLFANSTDAQSCCSSPVTDASPVFSAIFNDPDTGNTASKYRIQVASDAGFTTVLWDSGSAGTSMAACALASRCSNINYAGSALSLGGVTYYWKIKFWDNLNLEGVFSSTATFSTSATPTAPTNLFSNDSTAQTGLTNPVGILAAHPVFSAIFNDPDIGDAATKYRVQVDNNNNFSSPIWDSGASGTSMASCNQGARCADIVFGGADLEANEAVYYWRIKFWDAAGVEGAWSQDPIATTKFTMGIIGSSQQQGSEPPPQATVPETPIAGAVQVLDANSVRYNWIDASNNETGFRILNAEGNVIADVLAGVTQALETNLPANSVVDGRKVLAYNAQGQSPAVPFASVITAAPQSRPVLVRRGGDSVTFTIEPAFASGTNGFPGQTAIRYELIVTNSQGVARTVTSEWIQQNEYTFQGISAGDTVEVRVVTRNQQGVATEPTTYENVANLSRRFAVTVSVVEKGTNQRPQRLSPTSVLSVSMSIESIGTDPATSVVLNLPLPRYILYRTGTLVVDGRTSTDEADNQGSVANQNGIAASWTQVNPGQSHSVSFELAFDLVALQALRATQQSTTSVAANPIINLQASVSFAESDVVYMSPIISLEPDLDLLDAPVVEVEPEPEEIPMVPEQPQEEQPVTVPTPEETNIIEQILQQEFGAPPAPSEIGGEPTPQPTLQTGETITSSDAGSFNVDVTSGDNALGLTGEAEVSGDAIRFTGTTTQPFTVITLIFNDSITAIAVSDANGFWQTFVSADRLGIQPGEEATVKIEAIAAKGDLRSERVSVGDVVVSRGRGGNISAEFDTTVSESAFLSVAEEIQHQVVKVIENQEPVIQTTLSVAAPVVVVSSVPLWGYLPYAPTMIYHFITYAVGTIGRKKKMAARFYGVAYDSISKQPLALAIIRIYKVETALPQAQSVGAAAASNKKLVTTVVTDKAGRYDALLEPGQYTLEVAKPGYMFPSQIVSTTQDGNFQNVYNGGQGIKVEGETLTIPDVPLDPVNAARQWQLASGPKKLWYSMQKVGGFLAVPILIVGAVMSAAVVATIPDKPINWIIAIFYIVLLSLQIKLRQKVEKAWGVVYDIATNAVLPLTTIQLIEPASSKVVTSRLSDYQGRFSFLPEPGKYVIKASKAGYQQVAEVVEAPQTDRQPLHGEVNIEKSDQRISGDIAMRQAT